eukprot:1656330-Lingulodinium_polyedra.AAC.1
MEAQEEGGRLVVPPFAPEVAGHRHCDFCQEWRHTPGELGALPDTVELPGPGEAPLCDEEVLGAGQCCGHEGLGLALSPHGLDEAAQLAVE